jgi:hypothetical protein
VNTVVLCKSTWIVTREKWLLVTKANTEVSLTCFCFCDMFWYFRFWSDFSLLNCALTFHILINLGVAHDDFFIDDIGLFPAFSPDPENELRFNIRATEFQFTPDPMWSDCQPYAAAFNS